MMDADEIGTLGQDFFKAWCSAIPATAIPAGGSDKHGWDFYVQLRTEGDSDQAPERSCKVQVKTTSRMSPSAEIKVSNWERMAKERVPWFVVHVVLEGADVVDAYLVHVGEDQVARVLERLRALGPDADLRKHEMASRGTTDDRLSAPFPHSLHGALLRHIGPSESSYIDEKSRWIKTTGFDAYPHSGTLSVPVTDVDAFHSMMADWAVGLIKRVPIAALAVDETRFGITLPKIDAKDLVDGHVELNELPTIGLEPVTLSNDDLSESVTIECSVHVASRVFPFLPPEHDRIRLLARYFSITGRVVDGNTARMDVKFNLPTTSALVSIAELSRTCKAARLFAGTDRDGLHISVGDSRSILRSGSALDAEFMRFALVIERATFIAKFFDLAPSLEIDPDELMRREFHVMMLAAGIDRTMTAYNLRVHVNADESIHGKRAAILIGTAVPFGEQMVSAGFALVGAANWSKTGGPASITLDRPDVRMCFKEIVPRTSWSSSGLKTKLVRHAARLEAEGAELVVVPE